MNDLLEEINDYVSSKDFDEDELDVMMDECVMAFVEQKFGIQVVQEVLDLMERNPLVAFGGPGALVHYVETFSNRGYEEMLCASIERAPTVHTLWMLNRVINGEDDEKYMKLMEMTSIRKDINETVRNVAIEFCKYQDSK